MTAVTTKQNDTEGSDLYQNQLESSRRILGEATDDLKNSLKTRSKDNKILSDAGKMVK